MMSLGRIPLPSARVVTRDSSTVALVERKVPGSCGRPFIVPRTAVVFGLGGLLTFAVFFSCSKRTGESTDESNNTDVVAAVPNK